MARLSRPHPIRVALSIGAVAAFAFLAFGAPAANAGVLGTVTGQVEEITGQVGLPAGSVQAVEETVTAPVEGVTAPVEGVIAGTAPSVEVPHVIPAPSGGKAGSLSDQATNTVTGVAAAAGAATRSAGASVRAAKEEAETATGTTLPRSTVPSTTADLAGPDPGANPPPIDPTAPTDLPPAQRNSYVPPPAKNGSTGAPLPHWIAYVWPAVALTGPYLARIAERWGHATLQVAAGSATGSAAGQGVLGVHASGGQAESGGSSSLFQRVPSIAGHAFSSIPTPALVYLGLLVLAVIAVGLAVRREIAVGRRP